MKKFVRESVIFVDENFVGRTVINFVKGYKGEQSLTSGTRL